MKNIRDFNDDLKLGNLGENLILSRFKTVLSPIINKIVFGKTQRSTQLQKNGADAYISVEKSSFDVKARDNRYYKFKDILLETVSMVEYNKPGWLYKSNIVVYVWWNITHTSFVDGYILYMPDIREWITGKEQKFKTKIARSMRNNSYWTTKNIIVPIKCFPINCIRQINKSYLNCSTQQKLYECGE